MESYVANTYNRFNLRFLKGEGCFLYNEKNEKYLDLVAGIAVCCLGHNHTLFNSKIKDQLDKVIHVSNLYKIEPQEKLAAMLCNLTFAESVFFCNSGAEANEAAIKLVRKYGFSQNKKKIKILSCLNSFHGRTTGAISITGQEKYRKDFGEMLPFVDFVEFNNIEELENKFDENVCGFFVEIIQGEGGINVIEKNFLYKARELCDKYNAYLIFDEVQTGMGRTGKLFSYEHFGIIPDLITVAKALGNGIPIGALMGKNEAMQVLSPGSHASTFGGNYLSSIAGIAVLEIFKKENIIDNAFKKGTYFIEQLKLIQRKHNSIVKHIKGMGLMIGMELNVPSVNFVNKLIEEKVLTVGAGNNVVRFVPPLILTEQEIDYACEKIEKVLYAF